MLFLYSSYWLRTINLKFELFSETSLLLLCEILIFLQTSFLDHSVQLTTIVLHNKITSRCRRHIYHTIQQLKVDLISLLHHSKDQLTLPVPSAPLFTSASVEIINLTSYILYSARDTYMTTSVHVFLYATLLVVLHHICTDPSLPIPRALQMNLGDHYSY